MDTTYSFKPTSVTREIKAGGANNTEERDALDFFMGLSDSSYVDTGIIPLDGTGLLSWRRFLNNEQIVYQFKAGIHRVTWGAREGDPDAGVYQLAQPYRIVICDIADGAMLGQRHFYSPSPIFSLDDKLYHTNLPNTNCKGYRGTGVGWICLYLSEEWKDWNLSRKMRRAMERASGEEAYNDANMSGTDGTRFYQSERTDDEFLHNAQEWTIKTEDEGWEWVEDESLWIPVKVTSIDEQEKHDSSGEQLTLGMAMYGGYNAYYTDKHQPKTFNRIVRDDIPETIETADIFSGSVNPAWHHAGPVSEVEHNVPK